MAVSFRTAWPDDSPRAVRLRARRWIQEAIRNTHDHDALLGGARARVVHSGPLRGLRAVGRGVLVVSLHHGPFQYVPLELGHLGFDVDVVMNESLLASRGAAWEALGPRVGRTLRCVSAEKPASLLRIVRALRAGRAAVVNADADIGMAAVPAEARMGRVSFLGIPMQFRLAPFLLAQGAAVPLVLASAARGTFGRREVEFSDAYGPPEKGDEEGPRRLLERCFAWFEERVRARPEFWVGWATPSLCWAEVGDAPVATAGALRAERDRILTGFAGGTLGLNADPTEVGVLEQGEHGFILHARTRRFVKGSPLMCGLVRAAQGGAKLDAALASRLGCDPGVLADAAARLSLAGLVVVSEIRGGRSSPR